MNRHAKAEIAASAGDGGLIFDWKTRKTPLVKLLAMLLTATAVFVLPLTMVRIDTISPQVREPDQPARVMLVAGEDDPLRWLETARALGPSPSRFDPTEWPPAMVAVDEVLAGARQSGGGGVRQPSFLDFPQDAGVPPPPLVMKGARELPSIPPPRFAPMAAVEVRPQPRLYPLSHLRMDLPASSPVFDGEVFPEMTSQPWRFLVEVAPSGAVMHALALIGHNTPGRAELTDWLRAHEFPPHPGSAGRWLALAVTFHNRPATDATDDP